MNLDKILSLFRGKEPETKEEEDFVEEYMYMGDGTMELVRVPRAHAEAKEANRQSDLKAMLKQSQDYVRNSQKRMTAMRFDSSSSRTSSTTSTSDAIIASAVYTHSSSSSSYDSGSYDSGCSSSSSCD
ncbi:hypothetical protein CPT_Muldoon_020 [Serratia phage Muldoon]|uniref:Uncharacterized protein n=1 Tax=Serratia phage Muldoon TaxID=2601678 RepID=A0A5P8PH07_9CAUD|nr:hypothetical protein HYP94_gp020 [Serratia phage Muldoon]QFR55977.1 hypothetical protein CPT_Muldoon_020 [Serratia phage Muldoon]